LFSGLILSKNQAGVAIVFFNLQLWMGHRPVLPPASKGSETLRRNLCLVPLFCAKPQAPLRPCLLSDRCASCLIRSTPPYTSVIRIFLYTVETLRAEPVAPFHFTSYTRRPSGEFPFTHGQARGTLPFGLLDSPEYLTFCLLKWRHLSI